MEHAPEEIKKHVRIYVTVFAVLACLTVVTVAVSYLHLPIRKAIAVALTIAAVKASLVALFFMHLISERVIIYLILILTFIFVLGLLIIPTA